MRTIYLIDLMCGVSTALDYVSPHVTGHHRRVAMGAALIGNHLSVGQSSLLDMIMAALLHDIGAFSMNLSLSGLEFDADLSEHAVIGHRLLRDHPFLERASRIVLYHHTPWRELRKLSPDSDTQSLFLANIVNLADRVDLLRRGKEGRRKNSRAEVRQMICDLSESQFAPEAVKAFSGLVDSGLFWELMEKEGDSIRSLLGDGLLSQSILLDDLLSFSSFFSHIIDFRSRHTATHSQGVAETAVQLAALAGMSPNDQQYMRLAGNLHDIGKLAVPVDLLDKPGKLDGGEYTVVQNHALVCELVLKSIPGLGEVADWACQHHERINGKGYPHGLSGNELSLGSRVMQVADVFTAITEDRPYRAGMGKEKTIGVLRSMADNGFLDKGIVNLAIDHHDHIDAIRHTVQRRALEEFRRFSNPDD